MKESVIYERRIYKWLNSKEMRSLSRLWAPVRKIRKPLKSSRESADLITGFGESIYELVQKNSGIDLREADFTKSENAELNQAIQNIISEYIQNLNNLNADLSGKIGESIQGIVTSKDQKDA
nr:hypothetical protein [Bacillus licheniformis]